MRYIADFGVLEGEVLLFGGPLSNLHAAEALFAVTTIPRERRICTGDLTGYCAHPRETSELVLRETAHVVAGNCERQLAAGADACGCGFEAGSVCDIAARGWYRHAAAEAQGLREDFAKLPNMAVFIHAGRRYAVVHGGATDIARFIWPSDLDAVFEAELAAIEEAIGPIDAVVAGHCGIPFERVIGGKHWINAGVIGLPPHDGRPETRYAVLSDDGVRFHSLHYDHAAAASTLMEANLPGGYAETLQTGWWPSEDILPQPLRRVFAA